MSEIVYQSPLKIPGGYQLTPQNGRRYDNGFSPNLSLDDAIRYLEDELRQMGAKKAIVYTNYDALNNERLRKKLDSDSAVCVEVRVDDGSYFFVCDRWYPLEHNLYAISLTLRSLVSCDKWGVVSLQQLLQSMGTAGSSAAPSAASHTASASALPQWMEILGLGPTATLEDANAIYRRRAKEYVNDQNKMLELNDAISAAREVLKS
tara:strand:- start:40 stop:657 length:618 start_codon:yes stop_codon:yes gene_type:complete